MKLYTEEQVRLLLDLAKLKINGEGYSKETLLEQVASIELPSDEEIEKELYSAIEHTIIKWTLDGTKTAGSLTREIMSLIERQNTTDDVVYFQPPNINPKYCEAGMISETDKDYILYLDEPCKVLISDVKIIPKENVTYNRKARLYEVKQQQDEEIKQV